MEIRSGFYKFKHQGNHYLRIFFKEGIQYYQVDHGQPDKMETFDQLYGTNPDIKRITRPISVNNITATISFEDQDGDTFEFAAKNIHTLKRIFSEFPRVAKALK